MSVFLRTFDIDFPKELPQNMKPQLYLFYAAQEHLGTSSLNIENYIPTKGKYFEFLLVG